VATHPWIGTKWWNSVIQGYRNFTLGLAGKRLDKEIPEGHVLIPGSRNIRLAEDDESDLLYFARGGRDAYRSLTTDYEQYEHRARSHGMAWQDEARKAYDYFEAEVWVFVCVRAIMTAAAKVEGEFYLPDGKAKIPFTNLLTDRLLDVPNPNQSFSDLLEETVAYGLLTGMGLWDIGDRIAGGRLLNSLWNIQPDRLYPWGDERTLVLGWKYYDPYHATRDIEPEDVAWFRQFRPGYARLGMGRVASAGASAEEANSIRSWRKNFFKNNAIPAGWIETPKRLHGSVVEMIRDEFKRIHKPGSNEPGIFHSGAKYNQGQIGGKGGAFRQDREDAKREILASFGVFPAIVGDTESSNHWTVLEQHQMFWSLTVGPELNRIANAITRQVCPHLGIKGLRFRFKLEDIPYLDQGRQQREADWRIEVQQGLVTIEEYREWKGYGEFVPGHTALVPMGSLPEIKGKDAAEAETKADDPDDEPDPDDSAGGPPERPPGRGAKAPYDQDWTDGDVVAKHSRDYLARRRKNEGHVAAELKPIWEKQGDRVIRALETAGGIAQAKNAAGIARRARLTSPIERDRALVDISKAITVDEILGVMAEADLIALSEVIGRSGLTMMNVEGTLTIAGLAPGETLNLTDAIVSDWMVHSQDAMKGAMATAESRLKRSLAQGLVNGDPLRDLRLRVERVYTQMSHTHSAMIARTETGAAMNRGIVEGYAIGDSPGKGWLTMRDGDVRGSHGGLDFSRYGYIGIRESWMVDGFALQHPGDYAAPFELTHRCRCTTVPQVR